MALARVEFVVIHLLLAHWWPVAAAIVSAATLLGVGWLIRAIRSFDRLPVVVEDGRILLRVEGIGGVAVASDTVAGVRLDGWDASEVRARSTLNLALIAWPNVIVDLRTRRPGRRGIARIAHRPDDPPGFAAAVERLQPRA